MKNFNARTQSNKDAKRNLVKGIHLLGVFATLRLCVQTVINKAEKLRTPAEQKIAADYFPVLREGFEGAGQKAQSSLRSS